MAFVDLNEKTVIELRKLAKEWKVPLGAGISKAGIIEKLTPVMAEMNADVAEDAPAAEAPTPAEEPEAPPAAEEEASPAEPEPENDADAEDAKPAQEDAASAQPAFRQAYVAPPRFNSKPAYQAPAYNRQSTPRPNTPVDAPRATRPVGFAPRFGPAAIPEAPREDAVRPESARTAPAADRRPAYQDGSRFQPRPAYEAPRQQPAFEAPQASEPPRQPAFEQRPAYEAPRQPAYEQRPAYDRPAYSAPRREAPSSETAPIYSTNPSVSELIAPADAPECTGVMDLMPDGYGFLRGENLVPSGRDVYVAAAQVRRFNLRAGDRITGKMRPQRDGDKYPALLTVGSVNGQHADSAASRPAFDSLTPIYPTRRIDLESAKGAQYADVRLLDLITPIGFGQRGLIQCGPRTGKTRLLQHLANVITENHPAAAVMVLLFNETPEDVTLFREQVNCPVYASTFDMPPENHLKLADMVLEHTQRLVEMKHDVVLLVDSLTTLTKVATTTALQQGRVVPGMINPASLQKAKRLFGAARCLREGGSLTVMATMATDSGMKADDSVVNEFRGAANMELVLDQTLARAGLYPPIALAQSGTKRADAILTPAHAEGLKLIRSMLGRLPADQALQEVKSMLDKAATNEDLLARIKDWAQAMQG